MLEFLGSFQLQKIMGRAAIFVLLLAGAVWPLAAQSTIRIMAANTTSGPHQTYDEGHGNRIFKGLKPDIVLVQEFNVGSNSPADLARWVDENFGPEYAYHREQENGGIPNGIVSRYPFVAMGEWQDVNMSNRDFAWARIDIPGDRHLWAISMHLKAGRGNRDSSRRVAESRELANFIEQHVPEEDYLVIGGDFNTQNRNETSIGLLEHEVVTGSPWPEDRNGNGNTNKNRNKPYDWVLVEPDLDGLEASIDIGGQTFEHGLVFDSRVFQPLSDVAPVEQDDSGAFQMQHMAVIRDFRLDGDPPDIEEDGPTRPDPEDRFMRVHFIDVGQGDATLIEFACGAVLVDTGGEHWVEDGQVRYDSTAALMDYLHAFFAGRPDLGGRLNLLALTHPHIDHTRGVAEVIDAFQPMNVIYNGQRQHYSGIAQQREAIDYVDESEAKGWYVLTRTTTPENGLTNGRIDPLNCGEDHDPLIRVLWGQNQNEPEWHDVDFDDANNHSVVMRFDLGEASFLLTGDLESAEEEEDRAGIERLVDRYRTSGLLDVDVLQVGHHGSHNGTTEALLQAVTPEYSVISSGPPCRRGRWSAHRFGHPRASTMTLLQQFTSGSRDAISLVSYPGFRTQPQQVMVDEAIFQTGVEGTIVLEGRPDGTWRLVSTEGVGGCD